MAIALLSATYLSEKSWDRSADSITPAANSAASSTTYMQRRPSRSIIGSRTCSPSSNAVMPTTDAGGTEGDGAVAERRPHEAGAFFVSTLGGV